MKLKIYFLILIITVSMMINSVFAVQTPDQVDGEYKNMEQMMGAIRLEKKQVESILNKMIDSGRISAEEGGKAKREIASIKDNDLENLKIQAIALIKSK
jgi:hypothetical protein